MEKKMEMKWGLGLYRCLYRACNVGLRFAVEALGLP